MSIEVYQVRGDIMELIFDPREDNLRVGETLCVQERDGNGQGLICQIIEFRMVTYPALVQEQLRLVLDHVDSQDGVERVPIDAMQSHNIVAGRDVENRPFICGFFVAKPQRII